MTGDRLVGSRTPRLCTPPLGDLTPATSRGFEVADFARDMLGEPLLPWQEELFIRGLELRPDGRYRFRTVLCLVARQQGKTFAIRTLALWRLFLDDARLVLSTAQSLEIASEAWRAGVDMAQSCEDLGGDVATVRLANGQQELRTTAGGRWKVAASSRSAGRGLSVDLLVMDELREQRSWDAWSALSKTTTARPAGQTWCISNAGDDESVVLNHLRASALAGDSPDLAIFEWSAPDGCELDDRTAWAQANPSLGHTVAEGSIAAALATDPPPVFRTEVLCQRVDALDGAVSADAWKACADTTGSLDAVKDRAVLCLDVAPDGAHATLVAAALLDDGRVRLDVVADWTSTAQLRADLPDLLTRIRPRAWGWFPGGPAAALAADLRVLRGARAGVELKAAEVPAVCQAFAEQAVSRRLLHTGDPLLTAQVVGAQRLFSGDGWRFVRRGVAHVDAAYAAAGATWLARTAPVSRGPQRIVLPSAV